VKVIDYSAESESLTRQQHAPSAQAISVLYVEPDRQRASSVCDELRRAGFTAVEAGDAATVLQLVFAQKPSIVLLGSLPSAEGIAICHSISQVAPNALVLAYTAQPQPWQVSAAFIAGVVPPCTHTQELVEEICAWLMHGNSSGLDQEMRNALACLRAGCVVAD
jgi:DNA-binding response OmpR family regulator